MKVLLDQSSSKQHDRLTPRLSRHVRFKNDPSPKTHRIHGTIAYLPTWMVDVYGEFRCIYTKPMDLMGNLFIESFWGPTGASKRMMTNVAEKWLDALGSTGGRESMNGVCVNRRWIVERSQSIVSQKYERGMLWISREGCNFSHPKWDEMRGEFFAQESHKLLGRKQAIAMQGSLMNRPYKDGNLVSYYSYLYRYPTYDTTPKW